MFSIPMDVERSTKIRKNPADVFSYIADFNNWRTWSPWLCQEPNCPVTIQGSPGTVGHSQTWNGDLIGSGTMTLAEVRRNSGLRYDLHFLKPWKSHSKVEFRLVQKSDETEVTWVMHGTLPFFMFFMKKMMTTWVGSDYERGLSMLKEYLETGAVPSETRIKGVVERESLYYMGIRRKCSISEIGPAMEKDFTDIREKLDDRQLQTVKHLFSIYHDYDMVGRTCEYTSGLLYESKPESVASLVVDQLPAHKALQVDHRGPYRHLGNAWSAAISCARMKYKQNKKLPMYEIYVNNPHKVSEEEVQVEIYVPVK